jgi:alpha-mannosidase
MNWKIYVVPHTHWDKEWYFSKEESDVLLVNNMKRIKKIFESNNDYPSFNYDGQSSVIDEYLDYFPDDRKSISKIMNEKKLIVGPWYTQPDLFNITSESIVRNLLIGINTAKKYADNYLKIGYAPDSFGHNNQMPQIFKGFGLNNFIFWRGLNKKDIDSNGVLNKWVGLDNTEILTYNFFLGYWSMGSFFPYLMNQNDDLEKLSIEFLKNSKQVIDELKNKMKQKGILLLPLGGDQAPINELTPKFFKELNKHTDDEWILSDYETFFEQLNSQDIGEVGTITGELKYPYMVRIHKTIGSQRYDLKQKIKNLEYKIYQNLEPLSVFWKLASENYDSELINFSLKGLLTSQAHDSAGGCNSDQTNENIINRLDRMTDIVDSKINEILKQISNNLNLGENDLLVFNSDLNNSSRKHKAKIFTKHKSFCIKNKNNELINYVVINSKYHNGGQSVKATSNGEEHIALQGYYEVDLILDFEIKSLNYEIFKIIESNSLNIINEAATNKIKNKTYEVTINKDGSIKILNLISKIEIEKALFLSATVDAGDSYDYSPLTNNDPSIAELNNFEYKILSYNEFQIMKVKYNYNVPYSMNDKKNISQIIEMDIYIDNEYYIDVNIKLNNQAKNIKWILNNELSNSINTTLANQAYGTIERVATLEESKNWIQEKWTEFPSSIETMESFVSTSHCEGVQPLTFFTNGNNEYEAENNNLKITLFRSTDVLGRHDLLWRPGRASGTSEYIIETPKATLLDKELKFNFRLMIDKNINHWKEAKKFTTSTLYYQSQKYNNLFKKMDRFLLMPEKNKLKDLNLQINNDNFIITSFKKAENSKKIILRGFNSSNSKINLEIKVNNNITDFVKSNLLEEENENKINNVSLNPFEIATLILEV